MDETVEIAEKLFPSYADGPRRIGTDVFGDYLPRATWCFEAIGAFGRNLWPFSFSGSGRHSSSIALPWKGIYREETIGTLNRSKSVKKSHSTQRKQHWNSGRQFLF